MTSATLDTATMTQPTLTDRAKAIAPIAITAITAAVFLDSLRFKFTNHPNTQEIFGRLNEWAGTLGAEGLFAQTGLFSQYVIGTAELVAVTLLIAGLFSRFRPLGVIGSALGLAVMTGAISFHLFTPLGIDPNNDGGGLFAMAVLVWFANLSLLVIRRKTAFTLLGDLGRAITRSA